MEPAVKPAVALSRRRRVGVVATAATFQGRLFASVVERFAAGIEVVTAACPSWVELVEGGELAGDKARSEVEAGLRPLLAAGVDVVVLACTHFPFLLPTIREVTGSEVVVYDPAPAVARQVARLAKATTTGDGSVRLLSTAPGADLAEVAAGLGIAGPLTVLPWERDASS
jgi:glutamate racemase